MAWQSTESSLGNLHWVGSNTHNGISRSSSNGPSSTGDLKYLRGSIKTFSPEKTYIIKTEVNGFNTGVAGGRLVVRNAYGATFSYESYGSPLSSNSRLPIAGDPGTVTLNWVFKNATSVSNNILATYYNNLASQFPQPTVIRSFQLVELDWNIRGWSWGTSSYYITNYQGWKYSPGTDKFTFTRSTNTGLNPGKTTGDGVTTTNYISKYVDYDYFNLFFSYSEFGTSANNSYLDAFLVDSLGPLNTTNVASFTASLYAGQYIGRINTTQDYQFYNITGNKFLVFTANWSSTAAQYGTVISNIQITGGYHQTVNNERFLFTNSQQYSQPTNLNILNAPNDATYSSIAVTNQTLHFTNSLYWGATSSPGYFSNLYGQVVNLSSQYSKIGNGDFLAGVWENGIWNSGWRVDENVYEFSDVVAAFTTSTKNYKWRVQLSGPTQSVEMFNVGDKVSIGNIVSININEERKLIKNYFTVILKDESNIVFEIENNFPIRRIEKDSENHKIKITKNVWLNGAFLNGYFEGIWNNGLFKGYPKITEMYNTSWIDGTFDGGYFNSSYEYFNFNDTEFRDGFVGLSFSQATPHSLLLGDLIIIEKTDISVNPQYNGTTSVIEIIDQYHIVTDKLWGLNTTAETGRVRKFAASSLLQNVKFYDNNVAVRNSKQSQVLKDIWKFNSHLDVNYSSQSSTTINRDRIYFNSKPNDISDFFLNQKYGLGDTTVANLYGFITEDVLSSESLFRDIDSFNKRKYSLGTKYEIYQDFLGDAGEFAKPFTTDPAFGDLSGFFGSGWTYSDSGILPISLSATSSIGFTFSRTGNGTFKIEFGEGNLDVVSFDNTNINIETKRYSMIEFDILSSNPLGSVIFFNFPKFVNENGVWSGTDAFPVSDEIQYGINTGTNRIYFYNRPGLDLGIIGFGNYILELDNIRFYELDAVPFFQYTTDDYVNSQIQVPYQAIAPFIDYDNANFSFVDNITFGFDSIQLNATGVPYVLASTNTGIAYNQ
jgi:hypothetical protein